MTNFVRPNLVVIGAQKAGTTALSNLLAAHPDVFMPKQKEMNFFSNPKWYLHIDSYLRQFPAGEPHRYYMDSTPGYFWTERKDRTFAPDQPGRRREIPESILSLLGPEARLILLLRHPKHRAVSAFFHHFRMGRIGTDDRIRNLGALGGVIDIGFYSEHLANYLRVFPRRALRIEFFEEFVADPEALAKRVLGWLDLDAPAELAVPGKAERNENFILDRTPDRVCVRGGMAQVMELSSDPRFRKMRIVEPPIVEKADLDYLDDIYAREITTLTQMFPKLATLWAAA